MKTNFNREPVHLSDAVADGMVDLLGEPESVLGHRLVPNYAGVIRSGIKVPFEKGESALRAEERVLYDRRTKEGVSPREIEKEIGKQLRPKNVPYFSVYRSECKSNPDHSDVIRRLYGNSRGEIHRLRITFISDKWWEIVPHKLMAFRKGGLYCSSEPIGGKLIATRDPEIDSGKTKSTRRAFQRVKITLPCVPEECSIYQSSGCRFSGVLHFLILGVPGTDLWRLPTQSWYSVRGIMEKIGMFNAALARKGQSIIGIPFDLFKYEAEISRWDSEKGRVRVKQWVIRIDCPDLPLADLLVQGFGSQPMPPSRTGAAPRETSPDLTVSKGVSRAINVTGPLTPCPERAQADSPNKEGIDGIGNIRKRENQESSQSSGLPSEDGPGAPDGRLALISEGDSIEDLGKRIRKEIEPIGEVSLSVLHEFLASIDKKRFEELSSEEARWLLARVLEEKARGRTNELGGDAEDQSKKTDRGALPPAASPRARVPGQVTGSGF